MIRLIWHLKGQFKLSRMRASFSQLGSAAWYWLKYAVWDSAWHSFWQPDIPSTDQYKLSSRSVAANWRLLLSHSKFCQLQPWTCARWQLSLTMKWYCLVMLIQTLTDRWFVYTTSLCSINTSVLRTCIRTPLGLNQYSFVQLTVKVHILTTCFARTPEVSSYNCFWLIELISQSAFNCQFH